MRNTYRFETSKDQRIVVVDDHNLFEVHHETWNGQRFTRVKSSLLDIKTSLKDAVELALTEARKLYVRQYESKR